jgi:hypothetical protein
MFTLEFLGEKNIFLCPYEKTKFDSSIWLFIWYFLYFLPRPYEMFFFRKLVCEHRISGSTCKIYFWFFDTFKFFYALFYIMFIRTWEPKHHLPLCTRSILVHMKARRNLTKYWKGVNAMDHDHWDWGILAQHREPQRWGGNLHFVRENPKFVQ